MINIDEIFEGCLQTQEFDKDSAELLEKVLSIKSPMKFDEQFASDDHLDLLLSEMERMDIRKPHMEKLKNLIHSIKPSRSLQLKFI